MTYIVQVSILTVKLIISQINVYCVYVFFQLVLCVPVTVVENRPSRQVGTNNGTDFEPDVVVCKRYEIAVKVVI